MILRIALFLVLAYVLLLLLFRLAFPRAGRRRLGSKAAQKSEEMVLDPQCKSYLPRSEALHQKGHYFCSEECAKLYLDAKPPPS